MFPSSHLFSFTAGLYGRCAVALDIDVYLGLGVSCASENMLDEGFDNKVYLPKLVCTKKYTHWVIWTWWEYAFVSVLWWHVELLLMSNNTKHLFCSRNFSTSTATALPASIIPEIVTDSCTFVRSSICMASCWCAEGMLTHTAHSQPRFPHTCCVVSKIFALLSTSSLPLISQWCLSEVACRLNSLWCLPLKRSVINDMIRFPDQIIFHKPASSLTWWNSWNFFILCWMVMSFRTKSNGLPLVTYWLPRSLVLNFVRFKHLPCLLPEASACWSSVHSAVNIPVFTYVQVDSCQAWPLIYTYLDSAPAGAEQSLAMIRDPTARWTDTSCLANTINVQLQVL